MAISLLCSTDVCAVMCSQLFINMTCQVHIAILPRCTYNFHALIITYLVIWHFFPRRRQAIVIFIVNNNTMALLYTRCTKFCYQGNSITSPSRCGRCLFILFMQDRGWNSGSIFMSLITIFVHYWNRTKDTTLPSVHQSMHSMHSMHMNVIELL